MAKRIKKPTVKRQLRAEWFRRYELGESPPKIAGVDHFDVRTVRKHIELAKQEREVKEARSAVLRNALERHYADLCNFAEKLDAEIAGEGAISDTLRDDPMWLALKQHLPRSPLWNYLNRWSLLQEELGELREDIRAGLENEIGADSRLSAVKAAEDSGVVLGMIAALAFHTERRARGATGLNIEENFRTEPAGKNLVSIEYGAFPLGKVERQQVETVRDALVYWQSKVTSWEDYADINKRFQELQRIKMKVKDELAVVTLRRIVPGRCKYCPL